MRQVTLFFLFVGLAISQCNEQSGTLTGTGSSASLDNTTNRCTSWSLTITTNGPIARYSIALQGDFGSGFVDLTTPSNPCTTITRCTVTYSGPFPNALRENTTIFTSVPIGGSLTYTITGANANPPAPPNTITVDGVVCTLGSSCTTPFTTPYISNGTFIFGPAWVLTKPPLTGWTIVNGATLDISNGYPYIHSDSLGAVQIAGQTRTAPTAPWKVEMVLNTDVSGMQSGAACAGECAWAIGFSDGTKYSVMMLGTSNSGSCALLDTHWTNATTLGSNIHLFSGMGACEIASRNPTWWKICDDGTTNILFQWSIDGGNTWVTQYSESRLSYLASVSKIFVGMYPNTGAVENAIVSYKTGTSCP